MRITHADQLKRGQVVTLHNRLPSQVQQNGVVTTVEGNQFRVVAATNGPAATKHYEDYMLFTDFQIISPDVPTVQSWAVCWVELTGEVPENEVRRMLDDDCFRAGREEQP